MSIFGKDLDKRNKPSRDELAWKDRREIFQETTQGTSTFPPILGHPVSHVLFPLHSTSFRAVVISRRRGAAGRRA